MPMRAAGLLALGLMCWGQAAFGQTCPEPLASARRLVLVTAETVNTSNATIQRFERNALNEPWRAVTEAKPALIGRNGMAWAKVFRAFAHSGEQVKVDGDKRAPVGFFKLGQSFGFAPSSRPNYMQVRDGTVCVDDPDSASYNTITWRAKVGSLVHGENMWRVPAYKNGLVVDYPTDRRARAGSCIFIHIRLPSATGTAGCVAVPEPQVLELQTFAEGGGAVLAVVPEQARSRFACLPQR
jgi:L,D-peptidoglycan transpeptidase YkuD (ErfK/YbiS/YcfS/YnhG family)